jgi:hypothetical protein
MRTRFVRAISKVPNHFVILRIDFNYPIIELVSNHNVTCQIEPAFFIGMRLVTEEKHSGQQEDTVEYDASGTTQLFVTCRIRSPMPSHRRRPVFNWY